MIVLENTIQRFRFGRLKKQIMILFCETESSMYRQLILLTKTFIIQVSDHDSSKNLKSKTLISILITTLWGTW
jgi:hypothetical protein